MQYIKYSYQASSNKLSKSQTESESKNSIPSKKYKRVKKSDTSIGGLQDLDISK